MEALDMNRFFKFSAALLLLVFLSGCGGSSSKHETDPATDPDPITLSDCSIGTSTLGDCKI
jgi:hypothetical protein